MKHQLPHELIALLQAFDAGDARAGHFDMEKIVEGYVQDIGNHHADDPGVADE